MARAQARKPDWLQLSTPIPVATNKPHHAWDGRPAPDTTARQVPAAVALSAHPSAASGLKKCRCKCPAGCWSSLPPRNAGRQQPLPASVRCRTSQAACWRQSLPTARRCRASGHQAAPGPRQGRPAPACHPAAGWTPCLPRDQAQQQQRQPPPQHQLWAAGWMPCWRAGLRQAQQRRGSLQNSLARPAAGSVLCWQPARRSARPAPKKRCPARAWTSCWPLGLSCGQRPARQRRQGPVPLAPPALAETSLGWRRRRRHVGPALIPPPLPSRQ